MAEQYTYEQLKKMNVAQLREIAETIDHEAVQGSATMHKDHLLPALCKALDIHEHHAAVGAEKPKIKAAIRTLKSRRDEAMAAGDHKQLRLARRQIHGLKHELRTMQHEGGGARGNA